MKSILLIITVLLVSFNCFAQPITIVTTGNDIVRGTFIDCNNRCINFKNEYSKRQQILYEHIASIDCDLSDNDKQTILYNNNKIAFKKIEDLSIDIAKYGKVIGNGFYTSYISKTGDVIHEGDTLVIGRPGGEFGFVFITQGGQRISSFMAGKKVVISQIKSYGKPKMGYKLWVQFKGFGLIPVFIDYDNALENGEIINPKAGMTREQAISKLKEAKELLDLQMMTQLQYDSIKNKMAPIIKVN